MASLENPHVWIVSGNFIQRGLYKIIRFKTENILIKFKSALSCRDFRNVSSKEWCNFAKNTADCDQDEGFIDYLTAAFCDFPTGSDENWLYG